MMLHVASLPFPTHQGTQAAIRAMLECFARHGRRHELLTYAASGYAYDAPFALRRLGDFPPVRSLRSGPSAGKLVLDARMAARVRRVRRQVRPRMIVAHHVEAAAVCGAGALFFAHTDLGAELPEYAPGALRSVAGTVGGAFDRLLLRRAAAVATISPLLADRLATAAGTTPVRYVPPPWPLANERPSRGAAREAMGFRADDRVLLYAGNLDAYQGLPTLLEALARADNAALLLATGSNPATFLDDARRAGVADRITLTSLDSEAARARAHAAADVAVVPRRAPGGLPIKLLDAMSRGVPCVATRLATAGLPIGDAVVESEDDTGAALARAIEDLLGDARERQQIVTRADEYLRREHSDQRFLDAFDSIAKHALQGRESPT